jgi:hypothetical protein
MKEIFNAHIRIETFWQKVDFWISNVRYYSWLYVSACLAWKAEKSLQKQLLKKNIYFLSVLKILTLTKMERIVVLISNVR